MPLGNLSPSPRRYRWAAMTHRALTILLLLTVSLLLAACGAGSSSSSSASSSSTTSVAQQTSTAAPIAAIGPEDVLLEQGPALAPASSTTPGATVDGIQCAPIEQLAYHIHAHIQVYVDGQPRQLPPGIGLVGPVAQQTPDGPFYGAEKCYYWLHTHAGDGIIHIESPTPQIYTLGDFFDEWRQPLNRKQVGPAVGKVSAFVNGKPWTANPRTIPLEKHFVIQLDVGTPVVPFARVSFGNAGL